MSDLYMLDTDTLSFLIKRRPLVEERFRTVSLTQVCISVITEAEQRTGLLGLSKESRLYVATEFFLGHIQTFPWNSAAAEAYAPIRHHLEVNRQRIGDLDTMIAAHALSIGATLVTNNFRHFQRIPGSLKLENWLEP